jgi:Zn ribbon nucleic-acid-binding protein
MAQVFKPSANTYARLSIFGAIFVIGGLLFASAAFMRSDYMTRAKSAREQPVPFSHKHHVAELGIDCRYCHTSVERTAYAGIPPTQTCMNCHSQIWKDSPTLAPVRASFETGKSIEWTKVHDLPDFVYFNHSIHVAKGIGCASCHGRVDQMNLMWQENSLHMEWCLQCHRNPEQFVRPRSEVFNMEWVAGDQATLGPTLIAENKIASRDDCTICHR